MKVNDVQQNIICNGDGGERESTGHKIWFGLISVFDSVTYFHKLNILSARSFRLLKEHSRMFFRSWLQRRGAHLI